MDKRGVAAIVARKTGICRSDCELVLAKFFETLAERLLDGETLVIRKFGRFEAKRYGSQRFKIKDHAFALGPRRVPAFYPAKALRERMRTHDQDV